MDDGIHAVDVEEIGDQIHEHGLVMEDFLHGIPQTTQRVAHSAPGLFIVALLLHIFQQGDTEHQPPHGGQTEGEGQAEQHLIAAQHQVQDQKRQQRDGGTADVAHTIAHGGHLVHPLLGGHIVQKAVVIKVRAREADGGQNIQYQHRHTHLFCHARLHEVHHGGDSHQRTGHNAHQHEAHKQLFAHALEVAEHAQHRGQQRHNGHGRTGGIAPGAHAGSRVRHVTHNRVVEDGQNGNHDHRMGTVGPVVHHPALLLFRISFEQFHSFSPFHRAEPDRGNCSNF